MQENRILISSWWLWVNTICWVMDGMETMFYRLAVLTLKSNSYKTMPHNQSNCQAVRSLKQLSWCVCTNNQVHCITGRSETETFVKFDCSSTLAWHGPSHHVIHSAHTSAAMQRQIHQIYCNKLSAPLMLGRKLLCVSVVSLIGNTTA